MNSWLAVLFGMQSFQIARQLTTLEVSNVGRYGFMGGNANSQEKLQRGLIDQQAERMRAAGVPEEDIDARLGHSPPKKRKSAAQRIKGMGSAILAIVGLDLYAQGKGGHALTQTTPMTNPFDQGVVANCLGTCLCSPDFWTTGDRLHVDYTQLYEIPPQGFGATRRRSD